MDFHFTPEEEKFRREVQEWLRQNPPDSFVKDTKIEPYGTWANSSQFSLALGAKGWVVPELPKEYGGCGCSFMEKMILYEELGHARAPAFAHFAVDLVTPCFVLFATEEQKKRWLPELGKGRIFCEAFSEPEAGSDLASLKTRAVEDGDDYVINGQKIWTTGKDRN